MIRKRIYIMIVFELLDSLRDLYNCFIMKGKPTFLDHMMLHEIMGY